MRNKEKGFTLVELAIVMIIIGLLIGGVLKGQQLIENAKVTATISEVKGFQAAIISFRDAYGGIPGDMNNIQRLSGCDGVNCIAGDGNSLIGLGAWFAVANGGTPNWRTDLRTVPESLQVWKHLALADLITGVDPTASTASIDLAWGESHPSSALRGGYELFYDHVTTFNRSAHFLRLSNTGLSSTLVGQTGSSPASPLQAANIDRKMDDGIATTGFVMANYGGGTPLCYSNVTGLYSEQTKQKNCAMFFLISG